MSWKLISVSVLMYVVALAALAVPATAQKGVLGIGADPAQGVTDVDDGARYTALPAGAGTLITKLDTNGAGVEQYTYVDRRLSVPAVAYDGSPGGLSADGRTLVLTQPGIRFPQTTSEFTRLDTRRLKVLDTVTLDGTFTFDALSPDGRQMYLIEYTSPRDLTQYLVRAYDLERERLLPEPIIDPNESGEEMAGFPQTRATSPDGRWAYTLYESAERDHPPFIHALDTKRGTAVCIDLDPLADQRGIWRLGLQPSVDGSSLAVVDRGNPVALVDLADFQVSEPEPPAPPADADGGGPPWAALGAGVALLLVAGSLVAVRRRRRSVPGEEELERLVATEDKSADPDRPEVERDRDRECEPVR